MISAKEKFHQPFIGPNELSTSRATDISKERTKLRFRLQLIASVLRHTPFQDFNFVQSVRIKVNEFPMSNNPYGIGYCFEIYVNVLRGFGMKKSQECHELISVENICANLKLDNNLRNVSSSSYN